MCYVTCVTCQNLHVYSQRYLLYTSFNSSSENLLFKQHFQLTPSLSPPFCLKCIAVVRRSFFLVSTVIERIKRDKQLLMFNWSDSRQGENALNIKILQFLSFIKLCDSKSPVVRIKPFHSLTPMSDQRFAPALALVWLEWKCTCVGKIECYSNNI